MMVERLFLAVPRGCLQFVIVVFPDHTRLLFLSVLTYTCVRLTPHTENIPFLSKKMIGKSLSYFDLNIGKPEERLYRF